ncbi:MAG: rod shape-determining protein MreC [Actinobacteria bacterium]|nr:rod shape-determining protein MreC [Actinomycetota bacterium]
MRDSGRVRLALALLLAVSTTFLIIGIRTGEEGVVAAARAAALEIVGPIQSGTKSIGQSVRNISDNLSRIASRDEEFEALKRENEELKFKLSQTDDLRRRAAAIDQILKLVPPQSYRVIPAQVIAIGNSGDYRWTITIDSGKADGIILYSTVVAGTGLVGSIVQVSDDFAVVSLIIDPNVKVGVRLAGSAEIGYLSGTGDLNELKLQLFDPYARMPLGATIVSWGSETGKPYMPGLPIGRITSVDGSLDQLNRVGYVLPSVDVSNLDIVGVVVSAKRDVLRDPLQPLDE